MRRNFWLFGVTLIAMLSLAAGGAAGALSPESEQVRRGGTVIFGAEQDVDCFSPILDDCNQFWNSVMVWSPTLAGAFEVQPNFSYKPYLVTSVRVQSRPFRLTYNIRRNARWSDGRQITAADFIMTWRTIVNPRCAVAGRSGYEDIRSARTRARGKAVTFTFRRPYAWWRDLFGAVLPAHAYRGEDCNKVFLNDMNNPKTGRPIASGPFIFAGYQKGQTLRIVRNNRYWGKRANLNGITFRFLQNTSTEIQQMRGREVHAIYPQPQLELAALRGVRGLRVQARQGTTWEHVDIQLGPRGHAALKRKYVRQALIHGMNRQQLVTGLFRRLQPGLPVLNNVIYVTNQEQYRPNWNIWKFNPQRAINLLRGARCTGGPRRPGGGGIYSCPGVGRLSFQFTSTAGNRLRELAFEVIQAQLRRVGIELQSAFAPPAIAFGQRLPAKNFDLFMFAWVGSPSPAGALDIWGCGGESNFMTYCNRRATNFIRQANAVGATNPRRAATLLNRADALISGDIPTIPLYQKPTFLVHQTRLRGIVNNPTSTGPTYNAENWWLAAG